jgi:hypothetical protein
LKAAGHEVHRVRRTHGDSARRAAQARRVLLDIGMPEVSATTSRARFAAKRGAARCAYRMTGWGRPNSPRSHRSRLRRSPRQAGRAGSARSVLQLGTASPISGKSQPIS